MSKMTLEYTEKHHTLEVDGTEYEIPQRTADLEEKIRKHDEKIRAMSEYEANMSLLEILFGKKNAEKMFPDKRKTNLDKLAKCTKLAVALFMADFNAIQAEDLSKQMDELKPVLGKLDSIAKTIEKTNNIVTQQKIRQ